MVVRFDIALPLMAFGLALLPSCTGTQISLEEPTKVTRVNITEPLEREVEQLATPLVAKGRNAGIIIGVLTPDGEDQYFSFGVRDLKSKAPIDPDTIFGIGSVTKGFTAALLAEMVASGELRYEDTVGSILTPSIVKLNPSIQSITLGELVTHTSGLPHAPGGLKPMGAMMRFVISGENIYSYVSRDYFRAYFAKFNSKVVHPARYQYSNIGMGLLGYLLEVKAKKPFPELARERICQPLGMTTCYFEPNELLSSLATGYAGRQPLLMTRSHPIQPWTIGDPMKSAGGMYASARDLMRYVRGNLFSTDAHMSEALSLMQTGRTAADGEDIDKGWFVHDLHVGHQEMLYHFGIFGGYTSFIALNVAHRVGVVVLRNNFSWEEEVGGKLMQWLVSAYPIQTNVARIRQDHDELGTPE